MQLISGRKKTSPGYCPRCYGPFRLFDPNSFLRHLQKNYNSQYLIANSYVYNFLRLTYKASKFTPWNTQIESIRKRGVIFNIYSNMSQNWSTKKFVVVYWLEKYYYSKTLQTFSSLDGSNTVTQKGYIIVLKPPRWARIVFLSFGQ